MVKRPPLVLTILDGFGEAPDSTSNAVTRAEPSFYRSLRESYPFATLDCSGEEVGLPCGLMGNSEVGHLNIGAGRIVWQEISRIDRAIADGSFFSIPALADAVAAVAAGRGRLHLFGLVSDGGVHSSDRHVRALLELARRAGLRGDRVCVHAFLDGRDTPPKSAQRYLAELEDAMASAGVGRIATVVGRYWAMDRDRRWDRVAAAYAALTAGVGHRAATAAEAVSLAYARGETDEFVQATVVGDPGAGRLEDGDSAIFFNFRADRARQLCEALTAADFGGFERERRPALHLVTMTRYRDDFAMPAAFTPQHLRGIFPQVVSQAGLSQLRIAETEKYAHVTFFFSGGDERELPGERRILIPSPKVATYDLAPAMSAVAVTDRVLAELAGDQRPDVVVLNYANADMVGHTGVFAAAVESVRTLDTCLRRLVPAVLGLGGTVAVTADHGNCEVMTDPVTGEPHTAHTTNPVPLLLVAGDLRGGSLRPGGRLCDIAPTLLPRLSLEPSPAMEGANLL